MKTLFDMLLLFEGGLAFDRALITCFSPIYEFDSVVLVKKATTIANLQYFGY
jgi:hypothetical protein